MTFHTLRTTAIVVTILVMSPAHAQAPNLQPLADTDTGETCGCRFGRSPGETLLYLSAAEPRQGLIRVNGNLRSLRLFEEKFLPRERTPAQVNDHRVVYLSDGTWNVQMAGMVTASCAPKARHCTGTHYQSKLVVQWEGKYISEISGWGHCSC